MLNICEVGEFRQYTYLEPFLTEYSSDDVESAIGKLKGYETPGIGLISAELIQASGRALLAGFHEFLQGVCEIPCDSSARSCTRRGTNSL